MKPIPSAPGHSPKRDISVDIARGIGMVLVVLGHAIVGVLSAGSGDGVLQWLMVTIYIFHMALFFTLSGVFSGSLIARDWADFGPRLLTRMIWPYFLWSFILLACHYAMSGLTNTQVEAFRPWRFAYAPSSVMWFLWVLILAMVLRKLLFPLPRHVQLTVALALLVLAYLPGMPLGNYLRSIAEVLIGAHLGLKVIQNIATRPSVQLLCAAVFALSALWAWQVVLAGVPPGYPAFDPVFVPGMIAGMLLTFAVAARLKDASIAPVLANVGQNSMAIFVTHILITAGVRIVLFQFGITQAYLVVLLATLLGLLLPLVLSRSLKGTALSGVLGWR